MLYIIFSFISSSSALRDTTPEQLSQNQGEQEYGNVSGDRPWTAQHLLNTIKNVVTEATRHQVMEFGLDDGEFERSNARLVEVLSICKSL